MKITFGQITGVGVVVLGAFVAFRVAKAAGAAAEVVGDAVEAINPANNSNVISQGFNDVVGAVTGNEDFSIGSFFFDLVNPEFDPNAPTKIAPPRRLLPVGATSGQITAPRNQ